MDNPNNLNYCIETTKNHPIVLLHKDCIQNIHDVCLKDGAKRTGFTTEVCINIDAIEAADAKKNKKQRERTMDFCFGVKSKNNKPNMVLVELRLNYKKVVNLDKKELDEKITHSKDILGHSPIILNKYYFVFQTNIRQQAVYYLRRLYINKNDVLGIDLDELQAIYFQ